MPPQLAPDARLHHLHCLAQTGTQFTVKENRAQGNEACSEVWVRCTLGGSGKPLLEAASQAA
eukprot:342231-Pelagomonas_calceolata.AAC.1